MHACRSKNCLEMFNCLDFGERRLLSQDTRIDCDGDANKRMQFVGLGVLLLFSFGGPTLLFFYLQVRKAIGCLSYIHYSILNSTDTEDIRYLSDDRPALFLSAAQARAAAGAERGGARARSHRRVVPPPVRFIPDWRTYSVSLLRKRRCDRTHRRSLRSSSKRRTWTTRR